jgi:hypothetical protein
MLALPFFIQKSSIWGIVGVVGQHYNIGKPRRYL